MFDLKVTPELSKFLTTTEKSKINNETTSIKLRDLIDILETKKKDLPVDLSDLLTTNENRKSLEFVYPEPFIPGSSYTEEFKAQLAQLRRQEEDRVYDTFINKKDTSKLSLKDEFKNISNYTPNTGHLAHNDDNLSIQQMNKQIKEQVTTIFNILVSVLSVVWAVWYWSGKYVGVGYKILLCLFFGILVLVADIVVYNSYLRKIDEAKTVERKKKVTKKVIKRYNLSGPVKNRKS